MSDEPTEPHLEGLGRTFMAAMAARHANDVDRAAELLRELIKSEPRLPEPHLELGRILLDTGRFTDAEEETREGLRLLELGGQWLDNLPENAVLSVAHGQLAEVLRQKADSDAVIFGPADVLMDTIKAARAHFDTARKLDPTNTYADYYAIHMGPDVPELGEPSGEA